ncbi:MAG: class II fructose-bisphosphatase [Rhodospirillales bacterium]
MDRNLALEAVRATEAAARAAYRRLGQGDEAAADQAAVEAMEDALAAVPIDGRIVIGEGPKGEAEKLFVGERVGSGGTEVGVAVMPLEGSSIIARGGYNAVSAIAISAAGSFLKVPNIYMEKIAVGPNLPDDAIDIDAPVADNLKSVAKGKGVEVEDLVVCVLDRPRHGNLIEQLRASGARIRLLLDGDMSGAVATAIQGAGIDLFLGSGLAPQGIMAAAALRAAGGQMQARLIMRNDADKDSARGIGIEDFGIRYTIDDMVPNDVTFAATGITDGPLLRGIERAPDGLVSRSMVMRSQSGTIRWIEAVHRSRRND